MESITFLVYILALILIFLWIFSRKSKTFPPGPVGLPIVGYLPFLGEYPFKTFMKLGQKYGNVFSVPLGHQRVVVLNDWPAIKEALINQAEIFNGRQKTVVHEERKCHLGIFFSDGSGWRERRRFSLQHLRNLGLGKSVMEAIIMEEVNSICDDLSSDRDKIIDVNGYFFFAFLNIIWAIIGGKRFERNSEMLAEFIRVMRVLIAGMSNTHPVFFMPYLRYIFKTRYNELRKEEENMIKFVSKEITGHEKTYQDGNVRDFIDVYLSEIYKKEKNNEKSQSFNRENLIYISRHFFNAGVDTSNNTLLWGLLYMATWPNIQKRVQDEMDDVFGRERLPSYQDRSMLKYTNAVILEILRFSTIVPLSISHATLAQCQLFGFTLPKGTVIFPNLWAVHHDPNYWKDPDVFNPERFLNEEGEVVKPEYLIPFSVGGRMCLGESLAKVTSFLFFTCLLHRFTVTFPSDVKKPSLNPVSAITLSPQPFSLVFKQR